MGVVGKETGVRAPCVHLFSSCTSPTYVGVCETDTNLDIMRRPSPCLRPVRPPVTTTPHSSSSHLSSFSLHFYIQGATIKITVCRYTRPLTLIDAILMVFASFFNITRQVAIYLFTRGRRSSLHQVDNQYTCQITTWAAFFVQK